MGISGKIAALFQRSQMTPLIALIAFLLGLFAVLDLAEVALDQLEVAAGQRLEDEALVGGHAADALDRLLGLEDLLQEVGLRVVDDLVLEQLELAADLVHHREEVVDQAVEHAVFA